MAAHDTARRSRFATRRIKASIASTVCGRDGRVGRGDRDAARRRRDVPLRQSEPDGVAAQLRRRRGAARPPLDLKSDDGFCPSGHSDVVCTLHLAVFDFRTRATRSSRPNPSRNWRAAREGVPQQSTLQGNEWRFFSFSLANTSTLGFVVSVTAEYGDPNIYVMPASDDIDVISDDTAVGDGDGLGSARGEQRLAR